MSKRSVHFQRQLQAENVHAAWRMAVAERAAGAYAGNRNLAALAVAGSVGEFYFIKLFPVNDVVHPCWVARLTVALVQRHVFAH